LVGDAVFELLIELGKLVGLRFNLFSSLAQLFQ